ncbi:hypothetical protein [Cryobacterium luteum]|uniref:Uncharacterized protein n=1 Tax=Cryobacterium luteum TaxID=1424661 RepID=A0A1H8LWV3_9MICO|nr:hypothetical protein [Cryobacterium luteum]TFB86182.1 hypothetical protein E3O10_14405 [Cryobacterium luteum]SEO09561.1 hypothetical protein SAMN05216281_1335 [Cryobacterium luteum]
MLTITGELTDVVEVTRDLKVTGTVSAGANIAPGKHLVVVGAAIGRFVLEDDAYLTINGSFTGEIVDSDGLTTISGMAVVNPGNVPGELAIGVGSLVVTDDGRFRLNRDGTLSEVFDDGQTLSLDVNTTEVCDYDPDLGIFVSLNVDR